MWEDRIEKIAEYRQAAELQNDGLAAEYQKFETDGGINGRRIRRKEGWQSERVSYLVPPEPFPLNLVALAGPVEVRAHTHHQLLYYRLWGHTSDGIAGLNMGFFVVL